LKVCIVEQFSRFKPLEQETKIVDSRAQLPHRHHARRGHQQKRPLRREHVGPTRRSCGIEVYKSDRVADVSLAQWLALTPVDLVPATLNVGVDVVRWLKREKQLIVSEC